MSLLAFAGLTALFITRAIHYWQFTLDDAFITLRYAKHLAQGLGPAWNPNAEPMEGYTTVLWMVILALAQKLGLDGLWFAKASGILFAFGAIALSIQIYRTVARTLHIDSASRRIGVFTLSGLSAAYWPLSLHAVSGMETTFSCFILTLFFLMLVKAAALHPPPEMVRRWLALTALLAALTRPEAALLCAGSCATHLAAQDRAERRLLLRQLTLWCLIPGLAYLFARWSYFGLLFPLSFYVKATGQPWLTGLPDVLGFFRPFLIDEPWWAALFVLGARGTRPLRGAIVGAALFALFFIFPEHIMAFESRYLVPLFPLIAAVIGVGSARLSAFAIRRWGSSSSRTGLHAACAAIFVLSLLPCPLATGRAREWLDYGANLERAHGALARDLAASPAKGRIAMLDVGAVGYYADWHTIDTFGLNDAHVALSQRRDVDYVFRQDPDLLVLVSAASGHYAELFEWETPLHRNAVQRGFTPLCEYTFDSEYHLQIFARPGAAQPHRICAHATRPLTLTARR